MALSDGIMSEHERLEKVRRLVESAPDGVDVELLLAGSLAGPVSADRPDVPVWEYVDYAATHPDVTLADLAAVRFPVRNERGDTFPTSIDEQRKPGPRPTDVRTIRDVVELYAAMHEAGLLRWDAATRTIVQLDPPPSYDVAAVHAAWRARIARPLGN